jgi:hypothetical protein
MGSKKATRPNKKIAYRDTLIEALPVLPAKRVSTGKGVGFMTKPGDAIPAKWFIQRNEGVRRMIRSLRGLLYVMASCNIHRDAGAGRHGDLSARSGVAHLETVNSQAVAPLTLLQSSGATGQGSPLSDCRRGTGAVTDRGFRESSEGNAGFAIPAVPGPTSTHWLPTQALPEEEKKAAGIDESEREESGGADGQTDDGISSRTTWLPSRAFSKTSGRCVHSKFIKPLELLMPYYQTAGADGVRSGERQRLTRLTGIVSCAVLRGDRSGCRRDLDVPAALHVVSLIWRVPSS